MAYLCPGYTLDYSRKKLVNLLFSVKENTTGTGTGCKSFVAHYHICTVIAVLTFEDPQNAVSALLTFYLNLSLPVYCNPHA